MTAEPATRDTTIDPAEIAKFERMAAEWWDPDGQVPSAPQASIPSASPMSATWWRSISAATPKAGKPLAGLRLLDIGCGGGLLAEPMARLGAATVGIDPSATNIEVARLHAERAALRIDYRATTAEALVEAGERFDVVLAMEVVEHVADIDAFVAACAALVKPGGLLFVATINRTPKAFALAIVGAEYVLRWLPRGTHDYSKLVRPAELEAALSDGRTLDRRAHRRQLQPARRPLVAHGRHGRELHGRRKEADAA